MTESVIQPKPFPERFCMFDLTAVQIDFNISSMLVLLILVSPS